MTESRKNGASTSQAGYARHRRVSRQAVADAIARGVLSASLTRGPRGAWRIADVGAADREWRDASAPPSGGVSDPTFAAARARRELAQAELVELRLRKRKGELVEVDEVRAGWDTVVVNTRNRLLGITSQMKQRAPHLSHADIALWDQLLREALTELAKRKGVRDGEA